MPQRVLALLVVCLAVVAACRPGHPPPVPPSGGDRAPVPAAAAAKPVPAAAGGEQQLSLGEWLVREASQRPAARPRVEEVLNALTTRGIAVVGWKQVLGRPVGARFCMAGATPAGLVLAVCEYDSPSAAVAGRDRSRALFDRLIPNRELTVHQSGLLTTTRPTTDPAADPAADLALAAEARRLAQLFASL